MSDRDDTRNTRDNTRESGSMFYLRAERADTHTRGAPTDPAFSGRVMIGESVDTAVHGS